MATQNVIDSAIAQAKSLISQKAQLETSYANIQTQNAELEDRLNYRKRNFDMDTTEQRAEFKTFDRSNASKWHFFLFWKYYVLLVFVAIYTFKRPTVGWVLTVGILAIYPWLVQYFVAFGSFTFEKLKYLNLL